MVKLLKLSENNVKSCKIINNNNIIDKSANAHYNLSVCVLHANFKSKGENVMYFNRKNAEQKNWRMIKKGKHFLF